MTTRSDPRSENEARYDAMAPRYERLLRFASFGTIGLLYRALADAVELPERGTLVEVGCGPGTVTSYLLARHPDARILGVDLSREMVALARARAERNGWTQVTVEQGDATSWKPPGPVDAVVFSLVLSGLAEPLHCLDRALSWLQPGGRLAILDSFLRPGLHLSNWIVRGKAPFVGAVPEELPLDEVTARLASASVRRLHGGAYTVVAGARPGDDAGAP